ncbi:MAG: Asp-tRNA(Asn)/Glu-tRNA(Gln) amidotransferase subunit GatC [Dehalococcoidales bacterium]
MKLSSEQVAAIATLSRINLDKAETEKTRAYLSEMLDSFEKLEAVNTNGIPPTIQPSTLMDVLKEDAIKPSMSQEDVFNNAPKSDNGYFKVKVVLE